MIQTIKKSVGDGWTLAIRSVRTQIQSHLIGYAWNFLIPVIYAICFVFVKQSLSISGEQTSDSSHLWGVIRAFTGITLFHLWFQILKDVSEFIRRNRGILKGLNIGVSPFVLGIVFEGFISLMIRVMTVFIALVLLGLEFPNSILALLWIVSALLGLLSSAVAIGLTLAPWSVLYGDVSKALQSLSLPIILVSPIFYPAVTRTDVPLYWVNMVNPIASPLAVIADSLTGSQTIYGVALFGWFIFSIILLVWSGMHIRQQMPILLERV